VCAGTLAVFSRPLKTRIAAASAASFLKFRSFSWRQAVYRHLFRAVESSEEVVYVLGRSTRNSRSFEYE
jgi:hypothetical protein